VSIDVSCCRHCGTVLEHTLVDLGSSPPCNNLLDSDSLTQGEVFYPLHVKVCGSCFLAQLEEFVAPEEIFSEYSYFSSFSTSFVAHAKRFVEGAIDRFALAANSRVFEVASNDGYLLQHFLPHNISVLGIEPALNVAEAARAKGVPTISVFLGEETASDVVNEYGRADLVVANNVLAHTPDLNDFVRGLATLVGETGVVSVEFPHLMRLIERNQFDTIYHEHFSYFSLFTVERVFASQGLRVFDVEELGVHGGSLRLCATPVDSSKHSQSDNVERLREFERSRKVDELSSYAGFTENVQEVKRALLQQLISIRRAEQRVVGYGAPGKGNTLLNYCGIRSDFLDYMVDMNPYKQGRYTPGTRIPIYHPDKIFETRPEYVLVMPWNIADEIMEQLSDIRKWGGKFIVAIPELQILD
jgi:SAM-dependent methyltransferase